MELKFRYHPRICRGKNRFVEELPHREPGPNPTSKELLLERSIAEKVNLVLHSWSNPASRKLMLGSQ